MFALTDSAPSFTAPWLCAIRPLFARAARAVRVAAVTGAAIAAVGAGGLDAATYNLILDPVVSGIPPYQLYPGTRGTFEIRNDLVGPANAGKFVPFTKFARFDITVARHRFNLPGDLIATSGGVLLNSNGQPSVFLSDNGTSRHPVAILMDLDPDPPYPQSYASLQFTNIPFDTGRAWDYLDRSLRGPYASLKDGRYRIESNSGCGDERDKIIAEYKTYSVALTLTCDDFTKSRRSKNYSFAELNAGDGRCPYRYGWALIRDPLVIPASDPAGYGLDKWIQAIGTKLPMNSGYRSPKRNFAPVSEGCAGSTAKASRHMFGDAVDLKNPGKNTNDKKAWYYKLRRAAEMAKADYVEPIDKFCKLNCFHIDWRHKPGDYR